MSFFEEHAKPRLTEPGVKYFLNETLKQCHTFKNKHCVITMFVFG